MYKNERMITDEAKFNELKALLNEKDWHHLLYRKDEWIDMEMYENEEEMIEFYSNPTTNIYELYTIFSICHYILLLL